MSVGGEKCAMARGDLAEVRGERGVRYVMGAPIRECTRKNMLSGEYVESADWRYAEKVAVEE